MGKIVTVANNKGGVAKTTTVVALAHAWSDKGLQILAVDLDSQGNLTTLLSPIDSDKHPRTIREALVERKDLPIEHISENLDLVPATLSLSNIENEITQFYRESVLKKLLDAVKDEYDIIILDCPPALGLLTFSALIASQALVMPVMADSLSYAGMTMVADLASRVTEYNPELKLKGVVITKFKANKISNFYLAKIKNECGKAFVESVVHEATKIQQATAMKENIFKYDPNGRATLDYQQVADILEDRILG
jgi:chromosome partitioning protein